MAFVEVESGTRLFVQEAGAGRPVVLIAGWGLNHEVWDQQVRLLAENHRVLCIDLRGHGRSDKPVGDYSVERLARDIEVVLERLEVRDASLVGWSFGGQVSFKVAASVPQRLAQLVLVGSNAVRASRSEGFPFGQPPDELEPDLIRGERTSRPSFRRSLIASAFHRQPDADTLDWLVRCSMMMPSWAGVTSLRSMLHSDLLAEMPKVSMPVLQILGSNDPVCSVRGARWLSEQLANARLIEIDDCGHYPMLEASIRFNAALVDFLMSCFGPSRSGSAGGSIDRRSEASRYRRTADAG